MFIKLIQILDKEMETFLQYFYKNLSTIGLFTIYHLGLVALSMFLSLSMAFPLGILLTRPDWKALAPGMLNLISILQTIPSLAIIGIASAFFALLGKGTGWLPAITALFMYALLPIVHNTIAGLNSIPDSILKSAHSLGMTDSQILWKIEIPLATPVILAGIRTATILNIGTAALAAAIGADCLGTFIFQGISTGNTNILLAGAVPTALLAIFVETIFHLIERIPWYSGYLSTTG